MKKWLRRLSIAILLIGLVLAGLYEAATHTGRGWLRGDALYQGRPTSYWRARCDVWLERFDSAEDAARWIPEGISVPMLDDHIVADLGSHGIRPEPQTLWTRLLDQFRRDEDRWQADWPPRVLFGYPGSEPVLEELARQPEYRLLVERPLKFAKVYREWGHKE